MAFEIVAASRAEQAKTTPWRHAIRTGLALGGATVFMAVVGILMMFQNRPIIVGTLTLGYATLGLTLFTAGLLVARRGLFGHRDPTIVGGVVAGALAAILPALLAVLMSLVDLRGVFVALNPPLLAMLTFDQQPAWLGVPGSSSSWARRWAARARFSCVAATASGDRWPAGSSPPGWPACCRS